jgi:hypothetical protein
MSEFETYSGKGVDTFVCPKTAHIRIKFTSGGELPEVLSGLFTSHQVACTTIKNYIETNKAKKIKKGE